MFRKKTYILLGFVVFFFSYSSQHAYMEKADLSMGEQNLKPPSVEEKEKEEAGKKIIPILLKKVPELKEELQRLKEESFNYQDQTEVLHLPDQTQENKFKKEFYEILVSEEMAQNSGRQDAKNQIGKLGNWFINETGKEIYMKRAQEEAPISVQEWRKSYELEQKVRKESEKKIEAVRKGINDLARAVVQKKIDQGKSLTDEDILQYVKDITIPELNVFDQILRKTYRVPISDLNRKFKVEEKPDTKSKDPLKKDYYAVSMETTFKVKYGEEEFECKHLIRFYIKNTFNEKEVYVYGPKFLTELKTLYAWSSQLYNQIQALNSEKK